MSLDYLILVLWLYVSNRSPSSHLGQIHLIKRTSTCQADLGFSDSVLEAEYKWNKIGIWLFLVASLSCYGLSSRIYFVVFEPYRLWHSGTGALNWSSLSSLLPVSGDFPFSLGGYLMDSEFVWEVPICNWCGVWVVYCWQMGNRDWFTFLSFISEYNLKRGYWD